MSSLNNNKLKNIGLWLNKICDLFWVVLLSYFKTLPNEEKKDVQNIVAVVFFIWTPCQVSVSVTEIFFVSIYLKHREKEELEKEKSNLEKEEMALKEEEATNEQSTLKMEIKELKEKLDTLER